LVSAAIVFRSLAWLLAAVIIVLSLAPPLYRPTTAAPHDVEHLAIFVATGLSFGLGYRFRHLYQAAGLAAFAGAIEVAQIWDPGRHARASDFIVDATSACAGTMIAWLILRALNDRKSPN
jgi:VanZ family protein